MESRTAPRRSHRVLRVDARSALPQIDGHDPVSFGLSICHSHRFPPLTFAPRKELTLFDSTCLIVGIIIGAGIYQMAPEIARGAQGPWGFDDALAGGVWLLFALWIAGGLLSLCGALGYAELASAYPREGGDYIYLSRAYGPWAGFLFGWVQLSVVRPGDIAIMAFAFGKYAITIHDPFRGQVYPIGAGFGGAAIDVALGEIVYAAAAVIALTLINVLGVKQGKWTQNTLTVVKALGLLAIVAVALFAPRPHPAPAAAPAFTPTLLLTMIFILFVFGGWNEMAYVAAEVKNPRKNIVRALVLGTVAVTVLYLLVNGAFLYALGFEGMSNSGAVATDTVATVFPESASRIISVLICISALGAVNGLVFTGARISYAVGADHRAFAVLGKWNPQTATPARALLVQGAIALLLILALGTFQDTIIYTAPAVYSFYLATSFAVIVLRCKDPRTERPYRVWGYPATTLLFCAVCGVLIYSAVTYNPPVAIAAGAIALLGLPIYWCSTRRDNDASQRE